MWVGPPGVQASRRLAGWQPACVALIHKPPSQCCGSRRRESTRPLRADRRLHAGYTSDGFVRYLSVKTDVSLPCLSAKWTTVQWTCEIKSEHTKTVQI